MNQKSIKRETEVKALVLQQLIKRGRLSVGAPIADEYPLIGTGVRADLVFLQRRRVVGIEIKTEADSLRRLERQLCVYEHYFDHTLLVIASRHFSNISTNDYPGVEMWSISPANKLTVVHRGKRHESMEPPPFLELLTAKERRQLSAAPIGSRQKFFSAFISRYESTSNHFWDAVSDPVQPKDLSLLSRFKPLRLEQSKQAEDSRSRFQSWGNFK